MDGVRRVRVELAPYSNSLLRRGAPYYSLLFPTNSLLFPTNSFLLLTCIP